MEQELVVVLDFGGQYNQLIARRVREAKVYSEMLPYNIPLAELKALNPKGIIFSGGPLSVYGEKAPYCDPGIYELGVPILGICYGLQLMVHQLGGKVTSAGVREYGKTMLQVKAAEGLFRGMPSEAQVWMSHGDSVEMLPEGFAVTGTTTHTPNAAIADQGRRFYGVQFHPEVKHTLAGQSMLEHFLYDVCGCAGDWTMESFIDQQIAAIRARVGDKKVLCALSGGVDYSVAAVLVHRAIGDRLTCVFVDHGFMRKDEAEQVKETFTGRFNMNLVFVDARERFMGKLTEVSEPEQKRKLIGTEFIRLFEDEAKKLGQVEFLVQGTLYPDIVESGTSTAATIKSHHNVGGLPEDMQFALIEPLR
ncbi:MAG: glutamine-hydrolyzing GMP synthase, partial [Peptococcaceae bacterium]|nr:glutamine-hydrolyzing GMP synthase [Peptococcaceae bacterium]